MFNKGYHLGPLNLSEEAIVVYDDGVKRFGDVPEPALREFVARALVNKGYCLGVLNRIAEAIVVYDDVVKRFATPPSHPCASG